MTKQKIKRALLSVSAIAFASSIVLFTAVGSAYASGKRLIPLGKTTGIRVFSGGAMIVGFAEIGDDKKSPAKQGGLLPGDVVTAVNGCRVKSTEELSGALSSLSENSAVLTFKRGERTMKQTVNELAKTSDGYKIGAWVRDSMAGIGTITYVDPDTGEFGALGHGICDVDTGTLMPVERGSTMPSEVTGAIRGEPGSPGQLTADFDLANDTGILYENTLSGVFGILTDSGIYSGLEAMEVANAGEVSTGNAAILSNVEGNTVESFSAKITKIIRNGETSRDFVIEITDKQLIEKTGGIVQGMSGSPVVQNGRLVGAVTHVLVNDPARGYGIFAENMLKAAGKQLKAA